MEDKGFLGELFDSKLLAIIELFLENKNTHLYLREISQMCKVPPATTFRILKKLRGLEIIRMDQMKHFKFYRLEDNERTNVLQSLIAKKPLDKFISLAKKTAGVNAILLYGSKQEDEANIIFIGDKINKQELEGIVSRLKEENKFTVKFLCFTTDQFEQMSSMGMYPHSKKVLWKTI